MKPDVFPLHSFSPLDTRSGQLRSSAKKRERKYADPTTFPLPVVQTFSRKKIVCDQNSLFINFFPLRRHCGGVGYGTVYHGTWHSIVKASEAPNAPGGGFVLCVGGVRTRSTFFPRNFYTPHCYGWLFLHENLESTAFTRRILRRKSLSWLLLSLATKCSLWNPPSFSSSPFSPHVKSAYKSHKRISTFALLLSPSSFWSFPSGPLRFPA